MGKGTDVVLALTAQQAILVIHALLAANIHSEQTAALLGGDNTEQAMARADIDANIRARAAIVDLIDIAIVGKAA